MNAPAERAPAGGERGDRRRRLRALIVKESRQMLRDPSSLLIAVVLPLILLFIFGFGLSLDNDRIKLALVIEDETPEATSLARGFVNTPYFDVLRIARDRRTVERDLVAGRLRGYVVIDQDFAAALAGGDGRPAPVQVIADGTEPNVAAFVENYARGVVEQWLAVRAVSRGNAAAAKPPIAALPRVWFNASLESRNMLVPGSIAVIMTLIGTMLTALVVAREWERGTMEALMATPVGIAELLLGKVLPYFLLGLAAMAVCVLVAIFVFGVPLRGSAGALLATSVAFLFPALGQGLVISAATKNQFVASQLALMSGFLPSYLLSGLVFEIDSMPAPVRLVTYLVQARYFVANLKTVFLAGDIWPLLLPNMGAMLLIAAGFFALALRATRKRLE